MAKIFVTPLPENEIIPLTKGLEGKGFSFSYPPHTYFQAKIKGVTCTLYKSLKLTVQGKEMASFIEFFLEPEILKQPLYTYKEELLIEELDKRTRIGVDEAGKGDYFGPLCVAGVMADKTTFPILIQLGVCDSKKLSDTIIQKIAPKIVKTVPNYIVRLHPKRYNTLYQSFHNLNKLLAWCHATVIEHLSPHSSLVIVDKFAHESLVENALKKKGVQIKVEQRTKGEEDLVVAAASIIARWAFINGLKELETTYACTLPKGASKNVVQAAKEIVKERGLDIFSEIAKLHFKTTQQIAQC